MDSWRPAAMQRFIIRFSAALSAFAVANVASFFVRSDDPFTRDMPDALERVGFPLLVYQDGGPVALCFFSRTALCGNILIAVLLSLGMAACYPSLRQDLLRTLGFESYAS
jgi:hypothetical protein